MSKTKRVTDLYRVEGEAGKPGYLISREHPFVVRFTHWVTAVALPVMILSGLQIFRSFPSFGAKKPIGLVIHIPKWKWLGLGGWLGGGLQWHLTFMWPLILAGLLYIAYQIFSGHWRQLLFTRGDVPGVWPMFRHYFLFAPKPEQLESYNPLQKLAYTVAILLGVVVTLTGFAIWKPSQLTWLVWMMGGFRLARLWHFIAMAGFVAFIPGHILMVALHGWGSFWSMISGWKKNPDYVKLPPPAPPVLPEDVPQALPGAGD